MVEYTEQEKQLLNRYSKNYYKAINRCLKYGFDSRECNEYNYMFNSNIDNLNADINLMDDIFLKSKKNYTGKLYRGIKTKEHSEDTENIINKKYISTSTDIDESIPFMDIEKNQYLYEITLDPKVNYIDMKDVSNTPQENEVLLPRNLIFKLVRIEKHGDIDKYVVYANYLHEGDMKSAEKEPLHESSQELSHKKSDTLSDEELRKILLENIEKYNEDAEELEEEYFKKENNDDISSLKIYDSRLKDIDETRIKSILKQDDKIGGSYKKKKTRKNIRKRNNKTNRKLRKKRNKKRKKHANKIRKKTHNNKKKKHNIKKRKRTRKNLN